MARYKSTGIWGNGEAGPEGEVNFSSFMLMMGKQKNAVKKWNVVHKDREWKTRVIILISQENWASLQLSYDLGMSKKGVLEETICQS